VTEPNPAELYRDATTRAIEVARAVRPEQLDAPTPCAEWSVQDLLDHLVGGTNFLGAALGARETQPPTPATADDLAAGVADCIARLAGPAALTHRSASPLGFEWSGLETTAGTFMDVLAVASRPVTIDSEPGSDHASVAMPKTIWCDPGLA